MGAASSGIVKPFQGFIILRFVTQGALRDPGLWSATPSA
jgi:hypothetical protein